MVTPHFYQSLYIFKYKQFFTLSYPWRGYLCSTCIPSETKGRMDGKEKSEGGQTGNCEMMDEGLTWLSSQSPYSNSTRADGDKRPSNEAKWGFYHPFPFFIPLSSHLSFRLFVYLEKKKFTETCMTGWPTVVCWPQGCSLEKSLTQLETCGKTPRVGIVYATCVCVYVKVCFKAHLSHALI